MIMTLYRQLLLWMLVVFFTLISAVFTIQFTTIKHNLIEQQSTDLNNVIRSVGFALTPYLKDKDTVAAESVINATFDSGYYSQIKLQLIDSNKKLIRDNIHSTNEVPHWFQSLIDIKTVSQTTTLTDGWLQLAYLTITNNPMLTYNQLWQATIQLLFGFISCMAISAILLSLILRKILAPLKQLQNSASEMAKNHVTAALSIPRTRELAEVVNTFNTMNVQLQQHFKQQAQETDHLRIRAYQDPVSDLANRSYFITKLTSWLSSQQMGGIALLKVDAITDSYQQLGYEAGDLQVQKLATYLRELTADNVTIARLSQSEFVLLALDVSPEDLLETGRRMFEMATELHSDPLNISPPKAVVGLVMRTNNDTITTLLSRADNALNKARQMTTDPIYLLTNNEEQPNFALGKQQWKALVDEAIANQLIQFTFQKAIDTNNNIIHKEVFASIKKDHQHFNAGQFLAAIENLNEGPAFDRYVIKQVFQQLIKTPKSVPVAINITQSSINDTGFIRWLNNKLQSYSQLKDLILFELPEICFIKHIDNTILLCDIIHQNNFQFGIDNYGQNFSSTKYLNELRPNYVKLDFAYTTQLDNDTKTDLLKSITRNANNLAVLTIASRVETIEQKNRLAQLNVQGFQGYVTEQLANEK